MATKSAHTVHWRLLHPISIGIIAAVAVTRAYCAPPDIRPTTLAGHKRTVEALAFSPDNAQLASGSEDGSLKCWNLSDAREIPLQPSKNAIVCAIAWSPDGKTLASAHADGTIRLWDTHQHQETGRLEEHNGGVRSVGFSRDGQLLMSAGEGGSIRIWDLATKQQKSAITAADNWLERTAVSPDFKTAICIDFHGVLRIFDLTTGSKLSEAKTGYALCIFYSRDGKATVTCDSDGDLLVYNVEDLAHPIRVADASPRVLPGDVGYTMEFSPDGRRSFTCDSDYTIGVWDTRSWKRIANLPPANKSSSERHATSLRCLAISPNGEILASGDMSGTIKVWNVKTLVAQ